MFGGLRQFLAASSVLSRQPTWAANAGYQQVQGEDWRDQHAITAAYEEIGVCGGVPQQHLQRSDAGATGGRRPPGSCSCTAADYALRPGEMILAEECNTIDTGRPEGRREAQSAHMLHARWLAAEAVRTAGASRMLSWGPWAGEHSCQGHTAPRYLRGGQADSSTLLAAPGAHLNNGEDEAKASGASPRASASVQQAKKGRRNGCVLRPGFKRLGDCAPPPPSSLRRARQSGQQARRRARRAGRRSRRPRRQQQQQQVRCGALPPATAAAAAQPLALLGSLPAIFAVLSAGSSWKHVEVPERTPAAAAACHMQRSRTATGQARWRCVRFANTSAAPACSSGSCLLHGW